jgi:hypothetical protein
MARILLFQLLSCLAFAWAFDITGQIVWNDVCPNATTLGQAKASIDDGVLTGGITTNGKFLIPDVPDGTHVLSIISHDFSFDQLRIDVNRTSSAIEVRPYVDGTPMNPPSSIMLPYPVFLIARGKQNYFIPPESFNLGAMLSNPMMLLMVGGAGMMLAMPYLMKNLDPEALEDFKEQQNKLGGIQDAFQSGDLKAGISALMAAGEEQGPTKPTYPSKGVGNAKAQPKKSKR